MDDQQLQEIVDDAAARVALGQYSTADAAAGALVAEVRRLRDENAAALKAAREEGAAEMRERAVAECRRIQAESDRGTRGLDRDEAYFTGRNFGAWRCGDTIRALPLDAPGGGS